MSLIEKLDYWIEKERKRCECDKKLVTEESMKVCGPGCAGCRHYNPVEVRCDIRDDIALELETEDAYNDTVGRDHE